MVAVVSPARAACDFVKRIATGWVTVAIRGESVTGDGTQPREKRMTTPTEGAPIVDFRQHFDEFEARWRERLGSMGGDLAHDLRQLTDLLLVEQTQILDEMIRSRVASWALAGSEEKIPLDRISKEGLALLLTNPEYISNGELMELLKQRFPDI